MNLTTYLSVAVSYDPATEVTTPLDTRDYTLPDIPEPDNETYWPYDGNFVSVTEKALKKAIQELDIETITPCIVVCHIWLNDKGMRLKTTVHPEQES